jgi:hypothetical protein
MQDDGDRKDRLLPDGTPCKIPGYVNVEKLPDGRVAILFEKDTKSDLGFTILPAPPATPPAEVPED